MYNKKFKTIMMMVIIAVMIAFNVITANAIETTEASVELETVAVVELTTAAAETAVDAEAEIATETTATEAEIEVSTEATTSEVVAVEEVIVANETAGLPITYTGTSSAPIFNIGAENVFCIEPEIDHPETGVMYQEIGTYENSGLKKVAINAFNYEGIKDATFFQVMQHATWTIVNPEVNYRGICKFFLGDKAAEIFDFLMQEVPDEELYNVTFALYGTEEITSTGSPYQLLVSMRVEKIEPVVEEEEEIIPPTPDPEPTEPAPQPTPDPQPEVPEEPVEQEEEKKEETEIKTELVEPELITGIPNEVQPEEPIQPEVPEEPVEKVEIEIQQEEPEEPKVEFIPVDSQVVEFPPAPQTGDNSPVVLAIVALLASMVGLVLNSRKKN